MGAITSSGGHLCIDLNHVELTGDQQRELLQGVERVVVEHLARFNAGAKIVTITHSPNNGAAPKPE